MSLLNILLSINWFAVALCVPAAIAIGFVWYSPKTFFTIWWKGIGKEGQDPGSKNMAVVFGLTFLASFVKASGLAIAIQLLGPALGGVSLLTSLGIGLGIWLLLIAPAYLVNNLFAGFGWKVYLIETGNHLAEFLAFACIIGLWR